MSQTTITKQSVPATTRLQLGCYGEDRAAAYLETAGLRILDRNWRLGTVGELDIVAEDDGVVVFVEVKTRRGIGAGLASEAVTAQKMDRIRRLGAAWGIRNGSGRPYRFDIVGVYVRDGREPIFEWLQDVGQ